MSATTSLTDQITTPDVVRRLGDQAFNREGAYHKHADSIADHHAIRAEWLRSEIHALSGVDASALLVDLRGEGLLWSMVASVVGVSDTAIRKWRRGESIEPLHHQRLILMTALAHLYTSYTLPGVPFSAWLDTPVVSGFSATPLQLLELERDRDVRHLQPLLDLMLGLDDGEQPEDVLDRYLGKEWRDEAVAEQKFRIVTTAGGDRVLLIDE